MPTPNYGWIFPAPASTVDIPRDIEKLARDIDTTVKANDNRLRDTGWIDLSALGVVSFKTNYIADAANPCFGRRIGPMCFLYLSAKRATAALVPDANGNFTDHDILTITDARFRLDYFHPLSFVAGAFGGFGYLTNATSPVHWLFQSMTGGANGVTVGQSVAASASYISAATY